MTRKCPPPGKDRSLMFEWSNIQQFSFPVESHKNYKISLVINPRSNWSLQFGNSRTLLNTQWSVFTAIQDLFLSSWCYIIHTMRSQGQQFCKPPYTIWCLLTSIAQLMGLFICDTCSTFEYRKRTKNFNNNILSSLQMIIKILCLFSMMKPKLVLHPTLVGPRIN